MRILLVALCLLFAVESSAYTGNCAIWAQRSGAFTSKFFDGNQTGFDAAKAYVGTNGTVWVYPGCDGQITYGTLSDSVLVMQYNSGGWVQAGNRASMTYPRLGPASSPASGGAIRIVDGVTFAITGAGIQAAINDCPTDTCFVQLPAGKFQLSAPIIPISGLTLAGAGQDATKLVVTAWSATGAGVFTATDALHDVTIRDMTLDLQRDAFAGDYGRAGIVAYNPSRWRIERLRITNSPNSGIIFKGTTTGAVDNIVDRCEVDNFGRALFTNGTTAFWFKDSTEAGVNDGNIVTNNIARDATLGPRAYGFLLEGSRFTVNGNTVANLTSSPLTDDVLGLGIVKSRGSSATGNTARGIRGTAYSCQNTNSGPNATKYNENNTWSGNDADTCRFGYEVSGARGLSIVGGSLSGWIPVVGGGAANGVEVNDDAVAASDSIGGVTIQGLTLRGFQAQGIFVGANTVPIYNINILGNTIEETGRIPIRIADRVRHFKVWGNIVGNGSRSSDATYDAIDIASAGSVLTKHGEIANNQILQYGTGNRVGYGIRIRAGADTIRVLNNWIDGAKTGTVTSASAGWIQQVGTMAAADSGYVFRTSIDVQNKGAFGDSARFNKGFYAGGQFVNKILRASAALNFDLTAATCQDLTITVTGAVDGDEVVLSVPNGAITTDITYYAWVSAANTVTVRACDGALTGNPASATFKVTVIQ